MALRRTMDSWTSSLRPRNKTKPEARIADTAPRDRTAPRKRSLGRSSLVEGVVESPKKSKLDLKRNSIERASRFRSFLSSRLKSTTQVRKAVTQRKTLIPVYQKSTLERASPIFPFGEICERLRLLEHRVQENTEMAQIRVKELIEKHDALVDETDRLTILLQDKFDEVWELKEDRIEAAKELSSKKHRIEELEARLDERSNAFRELEKKYRVLQAKFSIAKHVVDSTDTESQALRNSLGVEQNKIREADEKLNSAMAENRLLRWKFRRCLDKLGEVHDRFMRTNGNIAVYAKLHSPSVTAIENRALELHDNSIAIEESFLKNGKLNQMSFRFDKVFGSDRCSTEILEDVDPFILSAIRGHDACVLACGRPGILSVQEPKSRFDDSRINSNRGLGIIPIVLSRTLDQVKEHGDPDLEYSFEASFMEIRDEAVYDLFGEGKRCELRRSSDLKREISASVDEVETIRVTSAPQILKHIEKVQERRLIYARNSGENTSHFVFKLQITSRNRDSQAVTSCVLNLLDLGTSDFRRECTFGATHTLGIENTITSLAVLLSIYSNPDRKDLHDPSRESTLTHLLSPALNCNTRTLVLVHLSTEEGHLPESIASMKIAQKFRESRIKSDT